VEVVMMMAAAVWRVVVLLLEGLEMGSAVLSPLVVVGLGWEVGPPQVRVAVVEVRVVVDWVLGLKVAEVMVGGWVMVVLGRAGA
jgi:hypothetical protein